MGGRLWVACWALLKVKEIYINNKYQGGRTIGGEDFTSFQDELLNRGATRYGAPNKVSKPSWTVFFRALDQLGMLEFRFS